MGWYIVGMVLNEGSTEEDFRIWIMVGLQECEYCDIMVVFCSIIGLVQMELQLLSNSDIASTIFKLKVSNEFDR